MFRSLRRSKEKSENHKPNKHEHAHVSQPKSIAVPGDNPVRQTEEDTLGRNAAARLFAQQILDLDAKEGAVVGVLGAWGSGKTSFINLARNEFEHAGVPILDFNPWMFSGAEQLVEKFFTELAAQLRIRPEFADIAKHIEEYGEAFSNLTWLPFIGPWLAVGRGASQMLNRYLQARREGVGGRRTRVERALLALEQPVVVVLDDIDRLSSSEIKDVFKLVRLTGNFPNIVYVLAFDRDRVEDALNDQGVPGRAYLEKILQLAVDLPVIPEEALHRQILIAVERSLSEIKNLDPFDSHLWTDVFIEIVRPLMQNMRDVRRYAMAVRGTVKALGGQVNLTDILALEAIRVFLPDVYGKIAGTLEGLTKPSSNWYGSSREQPHLKAAIDSLIEAGDPYQEVVRAMIKRLFPAADRHIGGANYGAEWKNGWLRERRVADENILRLYLERVAGKGLQAFTDAERAFGVMADQAAFESYLRSLDIERLQDVIASLEAFQKEFSAPHVVPAITVLLNLLPHLPERQGGILGLDAQLTVVRVASRLLQALGDPSSKEEAVRAILPKVTSLSAKRGLIYMIGPREHVGQKLVSEEAATEFEKVWRAEVRAASSADLEHENDLLRVLIVAKQNAASDEPLLEIPNEPRLLLQIFHAAQHESISQSLGSRAVHRSPRLAWDALTELFGSEEELGKRIGRLKEAELEGEEELLELLEKYLEGWRPKELGEN